MMAHTGVRMLLAALLAAMVSAGCQPHRQPARAVENAEIVAAVKYAHGLEAELFRSPESFPGRDAVQRHFRQGFSEDLAQRLAEHVWIGGDIGLRPGEPVMAAPDKVTVTAVEGGRATAVFQTPPWMMETWGFGPYTIVSLARENDRWVISAERGSAQIPD